MTAGQLLFKGRVRSPPNNFHRHSGSDAEKPALREFIQFLCDLCDGLPPEVVFGPARLEIKRAGGRTLELATIRQPAKPIEAMSAACRERHLKRKARQTADTSIYSPHRSSLINLRIDAELLLFVHQTGANLSPALSLGGAGRFRSREGYVELTAFKARAHKKVVYRVYPEYRKHFQRYESWRLNVLPDADALFPFIAPKGGVTTSTKPTFQRLRKLCRRAGVAFFSPATLRKASGNWWEDAAQGAGHLFLDNTPRTFAGSYRLLDKSRLTREASVFFAGLKEQLAPAAGPGLCAGDRPQPPPGQGPNAPTPDCQSAAGCLFCVHHRDVRSFDHVWQLVTYRELALVELRQSFGSCRDLATAPRVAVIERIGAKLKHFRSMGAKWNQWVDEAEHRMLISHYHDLFVEQCYLMAATESVS